MKKTIDHFGVELEFTGISRQTAANVLGRFFGANVQYSRASDVYFVADTDGFLWAFRFQHNGKYLCSFGLQIKNIVCTGNGKWNKSSKCFRI